MITGPPPGDDPALLVIEIPADLFTRYEWVQEQLGYREALIPAEFLNPHPVWRAWECAECEAIAPEHGPGWHSELIDRFGTRERLSTCPRCTNAVRRARGPAQGPKLREPERAEVT